MSNIELITTRDGISDYLKDLRSRKIKKIALDLEGDQGSIRYRYSISIFQCYDGTRPVIIDVLKTSKSRELKEFLTSSDIVKVMFSSENDLFMTQNVLGYSIRPIRDIAVAQKMLGLRINLSDYIGIEKKVKDSFQRANWLRRPIKDELISYAINDVLHLLEINSDFEKKLDEKGLLDDYIENSLRISDKNFIVDQLKQYREKFPGYKRLTSEKKELAKKIWIFREMFGEYINRPVGYIFSKKIMNDIINDNDIISRLETELNRNRKNNNQVEFELIERIYRKAEAKAVKIRN